MDNTFLVRSDLLDLGKDMRVKGAACAAGSLKPVTRIAVRMSNAESVIESLFIIIAEPE